MFWRTHKFNPLPALAMALCLVMLCGTDEPSQEYKLKAAFICNFARFIEWPPGSFANDDAPFVIGVVGADPFNGALEQAVAGKKVGSRRVEIRHLGAVDKITSCQILVIPTTDDESESAILRKVGKDPVLSIGESDSFCALGGCIRFFTEDNKMRFEINVDATDQAQLKISSKLLKLARIFKK